MDELLARLPGDPVANTAAVGVVALALLDFIFGTIRAVSGGTFSWDHLATWVRMQVMGHALPIILLLTFGQVIGTISVGDVALNILVLTGLAAAASYAATTIKSILDSVNPAVPDALPEDAT